MTTRVSTRTVRLVLFACVAAIANAGNVSGQGETLMKLADMPVPTMETLLKRHQDSEVDILDWIVLKNDDVIVTKAVFPRPNTIEKIDALAKEEMRKPLANRNLALIADSQFLSVVLPGDEEEFKLPIKEVAKILYHEDLILMRIDLQLKEKQLRLAYELLFVLSTSAPEWPGLDARLNGILFREAEVKYENKQIEESLVSIDQLYQQDKAFKGLAELAGKAFNDLIQPAYDAKDYPRMKHYMEWFQRLDAKNPVAVSWVNRLTAASDVLFEKARVASEALQHPEAAELARESAKIWQVPAARRDAQRRILKRFQRLNVAVTEFSGAATSYPLPTRDDWRHESLTKASLFNVDQYDSDGASVVAYFQTSFFEQWDPADLGRRAVFTLRQRPNYWENQPLVTSSMVVDSIESRITRNSPEYDERLASYIKQIEIKNPFEFEVRFERVPLRLEALFQFPLTRFSLDETAATPPKQPASGPGALKLLTERFRPFETKPDRIEYRRSTPEPDGAPEYHVAQVFETKYEDTEKATQALLRGDAHFLPRIMPWNVPALLVDPRLFVRKYAVPTTHVLQFNPKSDVSGSRELRRGLAYCLNREHFLKVALKNTSEIGRLSTSPFPMRSYATSPIVEQRRYDIYLGLALTMVANTTIAKKRELKEMDVLNLKMLCPPDPICIAAADEMKKQWERTKRLKVEIVVETENGETPADWDIIYRKVQLTEPILDIWPFMTLEDRARVESLTFLPACARAEFVRLDASANFHEARDRVRELHRHLWSEAYMIPLWEIDNYMAFRKQVNGFKTTPLSAYDGISQWVVQPPQ
ncbi:MAG: ABC transporter substrate-binding protein [Planctomycetota bacterium]|nr:ABC transporter substrate-binding protein [Planctomycetota bacterium]